MWEAKYSRCIPGGCTLASIVTWVPNLGGFVTTCHKPGMVCIYTHIVASRYI